MNAVFDKPSLLQRVRPIFSGFDAALLLGIALLAFAGMVNMYSVGFDHGTRFVDQRHRPLGHLLRGEERLVGAHQHVEDGVADSENVVCYRGHRRKIRLWRLRLSEKSDQN